MEELFIIFSLFLYLFIFVLGCDFRMPDQWETPRAYYDFTVGLINTNLRFEELVNDSTLFDTTITLFDSTENVIYVSKDTVIQREGIADIFRVNLESVGIEFPDMGVINEPQDVPPVSIADKIIPIILSDIGDFTDCFPVELTAALLPSIPVEGELDEIDYAVDNEIFRIKKVTSDGGAWSITGDNNLPFPINLEFSLSNGTDNILFNSNNKFSFS